MRALRRVAHPAWLLLVAVLCAGPASAQTGPFAHHVQQLLGLHHRVAVADAQDPGGTNPRSIRVELQADCYARIWLHHISRAWTHGSSEQRSHWLSVGKDSGLPADGDTFAAG